MRHILVAFALLSSSAFGASVTETTGRMEINWSTLRIRFFGEAKPGVETMEALRDAEKKAWQDGLTYANDAVRNLHIAANEAHVSDTEKLAAQARDAAKHVATSTFSYNTTYFHDGTVRVHLENHLARAIESSVIRFRQKESAETTAMQHSGVVFVAAKAMKPRAAYRVVDETGAVLFDVSDMAAEAYKKNLMGRWFKRPSPSELHDAVGASPLKVPASVAGDGVLTVSKADWDKALDGHKSLLVNGLIAVALP